MTQYNRKKYITSLTIWIPFGIVLGWINFAINIKMQSACWITIAFFIAFFGFIIHVLHHFNEPSEELSEGYHYHIWRSTGGGWICTKCEANAPGYVWFGQLPKTGTGEIFDKEYLKYRRGEL